jgi:hypothetical protein
VLAALLIKHGRALVGRLFHIQSARRLEARLQLLRFQARPLRAAAEREALVLIFRVALSQAATAGRQAGQADYTSISLVQSAGTLLPAQIAMQ